MKKILIQTMQILPVVVIILAIKANASPSPPFPVAPSGATGGSGGLPVGTHSVMIAGQPARIIVGRGYDPAKPTRLAYYLHGTEGGYTLHTQAGGRLRRLIDAHSLVYVAPQAPEAEDAPGRYPWYGQAGINQVRAVLDHMFTHYNVIRDEVLGAGASSGSWFQDMVFLPSSGAMYPSYFILGCGAGGMQPGGFNFSLVQNIGGFVAVTRRCELNYTIGTLDFLFPDAAQSASTYRDLGFAVRTEFMSNVGHCAYDVAGKIADYWEDVLLRFGRFQEEAESLRADYCRSTNRIRIHWKSRPGRIYLIQRSTDTEIASWDNIDFVAGHENEETSTWSETLKPSQPRAFYRLALP